MNFPNYPHLGRYTCRKLQVSNNGCHLLAIGWSTWRPASGFFVKDMKFRVWYPSTKCVSTPLICGVSFKPRDIFRCRGWDFFLQLFSKGWVLFKDPCGGPSGVMTLHFYQKHVYLVCIFLSYHFRHQTMRSTCKGTLAHTFSSFQTSWSSFAVLLQASSNWPLLL